MNVIVVPVPRAAPTFFSLGLAPAALPRTKVCSHREPSRFTRATSDSDSAFTTEAPTPWSPPEWA